MELASSFKNKKKTYHFMALSFYVNVIKVFTVVKKKYKSANGY